MQICRQLFAGNILSPTFSKMPDISLTAVKFPDISRFSRQVVTVWMITAQMLLTEGLASSILKRFPWTTCEEELPGDFVPLSDKQRSEQSLEPAPSELSQNSEKQRLTKRCLLRQLWRQSVDSFLPRLVNVWQIVLLFIQHTTRVLRWSRRTIRLTRFDIQFTCWKTPLTYDNDSILQQSQIHKKIVPGQLSLSSFWSWRMSSKLHINIYMLLWASGGAIWGMLTR